MSLGSASSSGGTAPVSSSPSHLWTSRLSKFSPESMMSLHTASELLSPLRSRSSRSACRSIAAASPSSPLCSMSISESGRSSARSSFSLSSSSKSASE